MHYLFDLNNVRYTLLSTQAGKPYNWLFFPGGPGGDSAYLHGLCELLDLPGNTWLIDLPGNGSHVNIPSDYDYDEWLKIFLPTIQKFQNPIIVGHSFGGMLPLLYPALEGVLQGFVVLNSAPSLWLEEASRYAKQFNLPDLSAEMREFVATPNEETFRRALDACMPYYFPPQTLEMGRAALGSIAFQFPPAVWWQRKAAELSFSAKWVPQKVPTMIIGGTYDCITPLTLFQQDARFSRPNIEIFNIEDAGHCGWVDNPQKMQSLFSHFLSRLV